MKHLTVAFPPRSLAALALTAVAKAHSGNVRRRDCTYAERAVGERHRHPGRLYCPNGYESFLTSTWMHY